LAKTGSQDVHAAPVPRQAEVEGGSQVEPEQHVVQPVAQLEQTPLLHVSPEGQAAQARPSVPHDAVDDEVSQVPSDLQQPVGQLAELQGAAQRVPLHEVPPVHCWQVPPLPPQAESLVPATHEPLEQQPAQVTGPQPRGRQLPPSQ
jgi:hypothetical protein